MSQYILQVVHHPNAHVGVQFTCTVSRGTKKQKNRGAHCLGPREFCSRMNIKDTTPHYTSVMHFQNDAAAAQYAMETGAYLNS